jgi:hypothetical protein
MGNTTCFFETLEGRALLSVSPSHVAVGAAASPSPAVTDGLTVGAKSTIYRGAATNQSGKTSTIDIVLTDMKGVRTGVFYVHNEADKLIPIAFTVKSNLTFSFKFNLPGETNTVEGKLSANGAKITAEWTSVSSTGVKGHGSVVARKV